VVLVIIENIMRNNSMEGIETFSTNKACVPSKELQLVYNFRENKREQRRIPFQSTRIKTNTILVSDIMTLKIVYMSPYDTIEKAARIMTKFNISCVIVQQANQIQGILTEKDVLTRVVASGINPKEALLKDIMTKSVVTIEPESTIETALIKMIKHRIKKLPVISLKENYRVIGILSMTDLANITLRKYNEQTNDTSQKHLQIEELLKYDEGQNLEFKSSFRYCHVRNEINQELEISCLKTVCAFLNAAGGDLIIGISDRNFIIGIEQEYIFFRNQNRDGLQNYLINQIANKIGNIFLKHIEILFHNIDEHEICQVHVHPSNEPAFLNHKSRQLFYVRTGNGSRPFNISDAAKYIKSKWVS
jgi:CBS domain-containing protein